MNTARKGAEYEQQIARDLRELGYDAHRSAASKGKFDVYAINKETKKIKLIQAKCTKTPLTNPERERIKKEGESYEGTYTVEFELWEKITR